MFACLTTARHSAISRFTISPSTSGVELTPSALRAGRELLEKQDWALTLFVEVAPGYELPIYLVAPAR